MAHVAVPSTPPRALACSHDAPSRSRSGARRGGLPGGARRDARDPRRHGRRGTARSRAPSGCWRRPARGSRARARRSAATWSTRPSATAPRWAGAAHVDARRGSCSTCTRASPSHAPEVPTASTRSARRRATGDRPRSPTSRRWWSCRRSCPTSTSSCRWSIRTSWMPFRPDRPIRGHAARHVEAVIMVPRTPPISSLQGDGAGLRAEESWAVYAMPMLLLVHGDWSADRLVRCAQLDVPMVYATALLQGANAPASPAAPPVVTNAEMLKAASSISETGEVGAPYVYGASQGADEPAHRRDPVRGARVDGGAAGLRRPGG